MNPLFLIFGLVVKRFSSFSSSFYFYLEVNKIPELMRGLGKGIREFNSARASVEDEIRKA